jgi:hypothetical protein
MGTHLGVLAALLAALVLTGCASGDPRLQGTWKSHKVPMPVEMVKVTKMETVRALKGSRKTKKVPKTVLVAKTPSAPPYLDLIIRCHGARMTLEFPSAQADGPQRVTLPYQVIDGQGDTLTISLREPATGGTDRIEISFDGPNRFWVQPSGGAGWKEFYERLPSRG